MKLHTNNRFFRLKYGQPQLGDILGGIYVRMGNPTACAGESQCRSFATNTANRTGLRSVGRVNQFQRNSGKFSFITDVLTKLIKSPRVLKSSVLTSKLFIHSCSNPFKVFEGNHRIRFNSVVNDCFRDIVVNPSLKLRRSAFEPLKGFSRIFTSGQFALRCFRLKRTNDLRLLQPCRSYLSSRKYFLCRSYSDIPKSKINTNTSRFFLGFQSFNFDTNTNKEIISFFKESCKFWLSIFQKISLIVANIKLEFFSRTNKAQTNNFILYGEKVVVKISKFSFKQAVSFASFNKKRASVDCFCSHVGWKEIFFTDCFVAMFVKCEAVKNFMLLAVFGNKVAGILKSFKSVFNVGEFFKRNDDLAYAGLNHGSIITQF